MDALNAMLQSVKAFLVSELSAVQSGSPRNPPPTAVHFGVDAALAEGITGLRGVCRITAGYAANGIAITLPSGVLDDDSTSLEFVYPLFVVDFDVSGPWERNAKDRPFFKRLAALLKTDELVFGYSADFDPGE